MKKRLSESQFRKTVQGLMVGERTVRIAHGVLVEGRRQAEFVVLYKLTRGAVSQAVNRVWSSYLKKDLPVGFESVTAVLPVHQAFIVRKWAAEAAGKMLRARKA